jgi:hypothetical protein
MSPDNTFHAEYAATEPAQTRMTNRAAMKHGLSSDDHAFKSRFEACEVLPADFDHRAHVRLAYVYLCEADTESAYQRMRDALHGFLRCNDIDQSKYHETLTRAWIMAVRHFMVKSSGSASADAFIANNPQLLDSKIMLTHYSAEVLFSPPARADFVEPDKDPIPRHET